MEDRLHGQMIPQLHDPYRTANDLKNRKCEIDALHDGTIDSPIRCVGPFLVATPREVVEAEGRHP